MSDEATGGDGSAAVEEGIDKIGVEAWFSQHAGGFEAPLQFERIADGLSSLTYRVSDGAGRRWALRRPPLGARLASAHDMGREYTAMSALADTDVPVPQTYAHCDDPDVIGRGPTGLEQAAEQGLAHPSPTHQLQLHSVKLVGATGTAAGRPGCR